MSIGRMSMVPTAVPGPPLAKEGSAIERTVGHFGPQPAMSAVRAVMAALAFERIASNEKQSRCRRARPQVAERAARFLWRCGHSVSQRLGRENASCYARLSHGLAGFPQGGFRLVAIRLGRARRWAD